MTTQEKKPETQIEKKQPTHSERFTIAVQRQFEGQAGTIKFTDFQKRLAQNYFISIDMALKKAEEKRLRTNEDKREKLPYAWANVNMGELALDVVAYSRVGLDPALPNHINMIPYKNNNTQKYDIGFIEGYRGIGLKAMKYGYNPPEDIVVEVVYSSDHFKPIKKDFNNTEESYEFVIESPFDRGHIVGGFYFHRYENKNRNKLRFFSLKDIEKRKPQYASAEFWGGEKTTWKGGKPAGKEKVEGWEEEMVWKTIYRAAYNDIPIDSEKIDENFVAMIESEKRFSLEQAKERMDSEIKEKANGEEIGFTHYEDMDDDPEVKIEEAPEDKEEKVEEKPEDVKPVQKNNNLEPEMEF